MKKIRNIFGGFVGLLIALILIMFIAMSIFNSPGYAWRILTLLSSDTQDYKVFASRPIENGETYSVIERGHQPTPNQAGRVGRGSDCQVESVSPGPDHPTRFRYHPERLALAQDAGEYAASVAPGTLLVPGGHKNRALPGIASQQNAAPHSLLSPSPVEAPHPGRTDGYKTPHSQGG